MWRGKGITSSLRSSVIPQGGASKASDQRPCGLFLFYSNPSLMQSWLGLFIKQKPAAIAAGLI